MTTENRGSLIAFISVTLLFFACKLRVCQPTIAN